MTRICGVYSIECCLTGTQYVGSSVNVNRRWSDHRRALNRGTHYNPYLQRAWTLYSEAEFVFRVLECCPQDGVIQLEQHYIDTLKPAFNSKITANRVNYLPTARKQGVRVGAKLTEEHKANMRAARLRNPRVISAKTLAALDTRNRSATQRAAVKAARSKQVAPFTGMTHSVESKARMREAHLRWRAAKKELPNAA